MPPDLPASGAAPASAPAWLDASTLRAMRAARDRRLATGDGAQVAEEAMREVVRAHHPALPLRMIAEAVAAVVQDPPAPERPGVPPRPPAPLALAERLFHALRAAEGRRRGAAEKAAMPAAQRARQTDAAGAAAS